MKAIKNIFAAIGRFFGYNPFRGKANKLKIENFTNWLHCQRKDLNFVFTDLRLNVLCCFLKDALAAQDVQLAGGDVYLVDGTYEVKVQDWMHYVEDLTVSLNNRFTAQEMRLVIRDARGIEAALIPVAI